MVNLCAMELRSALMKRTKMLWFLEFKLREFCQNVGEPIAL